MIELTVTLAARHITRGEVMGPCRCAVAVAIREQYPHVACVTCNAEDVLIETHDKRFIVLRPGRGYREFLQAFDAGRAMPTTLRFRVAEEGEHDWKFGNLGP